MICGCSPDEFAADADVGAVAAAAGERKAGFVSTDMAGPGCGSHHEQLLLIEVAGRDNEKWHHLFDRGKPKIEAR